MDSPRTRFTASPAPLASFCWSTRPLVSFITVTYGTGDVITQTLAALAETTRHLAAEVIVVDNPHPEYGHRCADRLSINTSGLLVIRADSNLGFGGGNELGVLHARGELLCFLNPDVITRPGWFGPLLDTVRAEPDCIAAPRLVHADGSLQEAGQQLRANGDTRPVIDTGAEREPDYASAACWLVRRSLHERAGGFDARFHPAYFEDVDLALRIRQLGGRTVIADVDVVHLLGGSTPESVTPAAETQRAILQRLWNDELLSQPAD
jgi:O-antigen biosynthesis protein